MFIGEKEIDVIDGQTVRFTNGNTQVFTLKQLEYLVTDEAQDATKYRELVMINVLPLLEEAMQGGGEDLELGKKLFDVIEEHDLTNIEVATALTRLRNNIVTKFGETEISQKFNKDLKQIQEVSKIVDDSFTKALFLATGIALGTYEAGAPEEYFLENIRPSHLSKVIQSI